MPARILDRQSEALRWIVARSCRLKAEVVARDEREETGLRAVLNFGHTIGHAIEAVAGYDGPFQHGEAVAVGMAAESRLAQRLGWIGPEISDRLVRLLVRFGLPTKATGLDPDRLIRGDEPRQKESTRSTSIRAPAIDRQGRIDGRAE